MQCSVIFDSIIEIAAVEMQHVILMHLSILNI